MLEERIELGPAGGSEPSSSILIRDLQTKLNGPRSARVGDCTEATSENLLAVSTTSRNERRLQSWTKDVAGRGVNVPVEHVEEGGLEIDRGFLAYEVRLLADCEVFIFPSERTRSPKGPGFITECEGSRRREGSRIPEWRGSWIEIRFVRLRYARNDVDTGTCTCCVASAKQDIACCSLALTVNLGRQARVVAQDG